MKTLLTSLALALTLASTGVAAEPKVGELHRVISDPAAAVRDPGHDTHERMTVWYPAAADAQEQPVVSGPPGKPLFDGGRAASDAAWRDGATRYPIILLSHGFGGEARQVAWLGTVLARHGYVIVSVDHPGNNGVDKMTLAGATLWWLRAEDLRVALSAIESDPTIAPHVDAEKLGVGGFSIGGYTALTLAGATPDPARYLRHCRLAPTDGVCLPQKEFPELDPRTRPAGAFALWRANPPRAAAPLPIKAMFLMAPAVVSGLTPASLRRIHIRTAIGLGDAETVATPHYPGEAAARLLSRATIDVIPGVNHYDFLDLCAPAGQALVKGYCRPTGDDLQTSAHRIATDRALALFDKALK